MPGQEKEISQDDFINEVINSDRVVCVNFFAEWCGPCRYIAPIIVEIAGTEDMQNIKFVSIDVDNARNLAKKLGITSIPTLIIFNHGQETGRLIGAKPEEKIKEFINQNR